MRFKEVNQARARAQAQARARARARARAPAQAHVAATKSEERGARPWEPCLEGEARPPRCAETVWMRAASLVKRSWLRLGLGLALGLELGLGLGFG